MGPNIKKVDQSSQATPFAEDFLKLLQGQISGMLTPGAGPLQGQGIGTSPQQYDNSIARRIGGVDTASGVQDFTPQLIESVTAKSNLNTDRNAAQVRESLGAGGSRLGTSLAKVEGRTRNEAGVDLSQLIAQILMGQNQQVTQARQFDVQANQQALAPFVNLASQGILPQEIIASPGIGSQILSGLIQGASAYLGGGGAIPGLGDRDAKVAPGTTNPFGGMPNNGGVYTLPPADPFGRRI